MVNWFSRFLENLQFLSTNLSNFISDLDLLVDYFMLVDIWYQRMITDNPSADKALPTVNKLIIILTNSSFESFL